MDPNPWKPHFEKPTAEFLRTYHDDGHFVKVFVAYYSANQPRPKLAGVTNVLFPEQWLISRRNRRTVTFEGQPIRVRETHLEGSPSLVVWNWYWVDGTFTDNDYLAQMLLAKARLFRSSRAAAAMAVATESRPGVEPDTILRDFVFHLSLTPRSASRDECPLPPGEGRTGRSSQYVFGETVAASRDLIHSQRILSQAQ